MKLEIHIIDAFTDTIFKGNSAAVIMLEDWLDATVMQNIAMQNNLSETAFLVKYEADLNLNIESPTYHIRWFSPIKQIDFCGHATLASAFLLFSEQPELSSVQFYAEAVGKLTVTKRADGKIEMDFPNQKPKRLTSLPQALVDGLSIKPSEVYQNQQAYFVVYEAEEDLLTVEHNNEILATLAPFDVAVTCKAESERYKQYDFITRYFWPANGGDEDPVTGSAHAGLAPLWSERLGKDNLLAYQASSRGGELECTVQGDRVLISGNAVRYLSGVIEV